MEHPRHHAFAGAGLPGDQHGGDVGTADDVEGGQVPDLVA
jgi:hypothetical protein